MVRSMWTLQSFLDFLKVFGVFLETEPVLAMSMF